MFEEDAKRIEIEVPKKLTFVRIEMELYPIDFFWQKIAELNGKQIHLDHAIWIGFFVCFDFTFYRQTCLHRGRIEEVHQTKQVLNWGSNFFVLKLLLYEHSIQWCF